MPGGSSRSRIRKALVSRDDFALAAIDVGMGGRPAWLAPHQDRRPAPLDGGAAPPSGRGLTHGETADPAERFAERAVAVGNEQRHTEHAGPGYPLRDGVVAFGRDEQRNSEPDVAVLQHDGDGG